MGKGLDERKRPRRWWTFLLVGTLCLSGCSASGWTAGHNDATAMIGHVDQESLQSNRFTHMEGDGGKALPQLALDGFSLVAENDTLGLYLREQYACIRVLDKATGYVWGSFREDEPEDLNETWARFGNSVVSLECIDSTGMTKKAAAARTRPPVGTPGWTTGYLRGRFRRGNQHRGDGIGPVGGEPAALFR